MKLFTATALWFTLTLATGCVTGVGQGSDSEESDTDGADLTAIGSNQSGLSDADKARAFIQRSPGQKSESAPVRPSDAPVGSGGEDEGGPDPWPMRGGQSIR
jgi:hypothetical protein